MAEKFKDFLLKNPPKIRKKQPAFSSKLPCTALYFIFAFFRVGIHRRHKRLSAPTVHRVHNLYRVMVSLKTNFVSRLEAISKVKTQETLQKAHEEISRKRNAPLLANGL